MRIALGSVQFGLDYGISNSAGKVTDDELARILALARKLGIDTLDTAQAYGDAESRIGQHKTSDLKVISKLIPAAQPENIKPLVMQSLQRLKRSCLTALLFHRSGDASKAAWPTLLQLQEEGVVGKLGVSIYDPEELVHWIDQGYPLELIQLPANLLDQRFLRTGWLDRLQELGCEIHVRSLFLQGLLLMQPTDRPHCLSPFSDELTRFDRWRPEWSPLLKSLSVISALPQVSRFVVGVCHAEELSAIGEIYQDLPTLKSQELMTLASDNLALINPANWRLA